MIIKEFWTKVNGSNKVFGNNDYVLGVIIGVKRLMCDEISSPLYKDEKTGDVYFRSICHDEMYKDFTETIDKYYPNLCEFYVEEPNWN